MMKLVAIFVVLLALPAALLADGGVLIPRDKSQPDPSILSLEEMEITITIDNGDARVFVRQIFANHTNQIQEGNYVFALPSLATVSDFAVWDGPVRIPAVILERKRAQEIYNQLKQQSIDPGLLQMGERGAEEAKQSSIFSARIVPIPAYGTKRLEFEYHQSLPVENLKSYFAVPLRPDAYQAQAARHLRVNFQLNSAYAIREFAVSAKTFPLRLDEQTANRVKGSFEAENVNLTEDFVATFAFGQEDADKLHIIAHRDPHSGQPNPTETAPVRSDNEPGFFAAELLLGQGQHSATANPVTPDSAAGKTIIVLMDTSLSMQWEKLERSYQAYETLLRTLKPADRVNVVLFNTRIDRFQPAPVSADVSAVQRALDFVRASKLRGGTDLQQALAEGLAQCQSSSVTSPYLIILTDGGATRGTIQNGKLSAWYDASWKKLPPANRPRTYVFAVGDDANVLLLKQLVRGNGVIESVLSTEPVEFKLNSFFSKIGRNPIGSLRLDASPESAVDTVYGLQDSAFSGSMVTWVGRYRRPADSVNFTVAGMRDAAPFSIAAKANLPAESAEHPQLPRLWARARVDALLEKIERDGEDSASINEIIRLSRQYKFVTPYTSFLAVPRALLRPRVIRPGDPVLRVRTDESIVSVVALFPFGLVQGLRYLPAEDIWQTRFLAPTDMQDGTYPVRLVLRDRNGHTYREQKTFVIASKTPVVQIRLDQKRYRRGAALNLKVSASQNTRTLIARLDGAAPVGLRWDAKAGFNTGRLQIPDQFAPGVYRLTVTAEDIAHNIGSQEADIEIVP